MKTESFNATRKTHMKNIQGVKLTIKLFNFLENTYLIAIINE
jgi:hypothetical protein